MHSLNLGWFLQKFNELREDWATAEAGIDGALDAEIQRAEDALSDVFDARDAAAASATAAAGSASAAGTSATAAQNSATAAASSATLANNKATAAGLSEAAAAQSATQAGNSATAAAGSATTASNAATNAAASETAAGQSATAAAGSATTASTAATNAAASAARAEEVEESIPEDYSELSGDVVEIKSVLDIYTKQGTATQDGGTYIETTIIDNLTLKAGVKYRITFTIEQAVTDTVYTYLKSGTAEEPVFYLRATIPIGQTESVYEYTPNEDIQYCYISFAVGRNHFTVSASVSSNDKLSATQNIIAPVLDTMIADTALTQNDFRIVNNALYRITTAVASGATLTPGTNCTKTTLAAILKALLS